MNDRANLAKRADPAQLEARLSAESALALIDHALSGDRTAVQSLVDLLLPAIRSRAARVLARSARGRNIQSALDDTAQQVLLVLFANQGEVLREWDPERRLSLTSFVGLVAERQALTVVRSKRSNPFAEDALEAVVIDSHASQEIDPEGQLAARELFHELSQRLRMQLSPYGMQIFTALFIDQQSAEQVALNLAMSLDAVYAWRSRLVRQVRRLAQEILSETKPLARSHRSGR